MIALIVTIVVIVLLAGIIILSLTNSNYIDKALNAVAKNNENQDAQKKAMDDINDLLARELPGETDKKDTAPGILETIDNDTYGINSIEDLVAFSNTVNDVNNGTTYVGKTVVLGKSLDFTSDDSYVNKDSITFGDYNGDGIQEGIKAELTKGRGFIPIGNLATYDSSTNQVSEKCFKGTFDGNDKYIKNILINTIQTIGVAHGTGFFGLTSGNISNLVLTGNISSKTTVANGNVMVGGIAGISANSKIENCYNLCAVNSIESKLNVCVGGIVGCAYNTEILNCANHGSINDGIATNNSYQSGICGYLDTGEINKCLNNGNIISNSGVSGYIGGMAGYTNGVVKIVGSKNFKNISSANKTGNIFLGGICGFVYSTTTEITYSYNNGEITSIGKSTSSGTNRVGGIVGSNNGKVASTYNTGKLTGKTSQFVNIGGIIGFAGNGTIANSYNVGQIEIQGTSLASGGIAGARQSSVAVYNCYYLNTVSSVAVAGSNSISTGSKTEEQMKSAEFAQIFGAYFMEDPEGGYPIFTPETGRQYDYQCTSIVANSGTSLTATIDAKAGDLIVATILKRDNLTIPEGWTSISTSKSITDGGITQTIAFAYKKVNDAGTVSITVSQASQQRMQINLIALHGGGTPSILNDVEKTAVATNGSPITVTKPCNELVIWATSTIGWGEACVWQTTLGVNRVSEALEPRIANFMDYRASGSTLGCSFTASTTYSTHIAGLKIAPD